MDSDRGPHIEDELVRRAFEDVPADDSGAERRARERLMGFIESESRPKRSSQPRRTWRRVVGVAAVAVLIGGIFVALPSDGGGPPMTAAHELSRLATVAADQPDTSVPVGGRYPIAEETSLVRGGTALDESGQKSETYRLLVRSSVGGFIRPDGSGRREVIVLDARFVTERDHEIWVEVGRPPIVKAGQEITERYGPGDLAFRDLSTMPTQPQELLRYLRSGDLGDVGQGSRNLLSLIGSVLTQPNVSPEQRAALFQVASSIEGVTLDQGVTDPLGREGVQVSVAEGPETARIIMDPRTSEVLALVWTPRTDDPTEPETWRAFI